MSTKGDNFHTSSALEQKENCATAKTHNRYRQLIAAATTHNNVNVSSLLIWRMIDAFLASLQALDFILITAFVLNPKLLTFNAGARTARISSSGRRRFRQYNSFNDTLFLTFITFFAFGFIATGAASLGSQQCSYEDCAHRFTEGVQIRKVNFGPNIATCLLLNEYNACLNKSAAGCRGDLRFLTLTKIARYYDTKFNCSGMINTYKIKNADLLSVYPKFDARHQCLYPYNKQSGNDFRYCAAFGDPHIRTFDGQHDTCKIPNAWPLIDNAYLNIQIASEFIHPGSPASFITKISVVIKALPGCTEQKVYTAAQDNLPSSFEDGTVHSGQPLTSNGDSYRYPYNDGTSDDGASRPPPALFIEALNPGHHVQIQLRYVSTKIVIRRSGGRLLSVAVKMPTESLSKETDMTPWQLCLVSCPDSEKINYKEALVKPGLFFSGEKSASKDITMSDQQIDSGKFAAPSSRHVISRDVAAAICKAASLVDFFFDSCVFDLMASGGQSAFRDAARDALHDIRRLFPPYKHYEANRSDFLPHMAVVFNKSSRRSLDGDDDAAAANDNQDYDEEQSVVHDDKDRETMQDRTVFSGGVSATYRRSMPTNYVLINTLITTLFIFYTINR